MLEKVAEQTGVTPPSLQSRPELRPFLMYLVGEFDRLSRDRRYDGGSPLPIHTGAVQEYWKAFELQDFDFETFHTWMVTIDSIWMDRVAERRKKAEQKPQTPPKSAARKRGKR